jgi:hypothetical protein
MSTERSRCSIAHAVWYEPISRARWRLWADTPSFWVANSQAAVNHTVSGVRVLSKIVPAVAEVRTLHPQQRNVPSPMRHPPPGSTQLGQTNPSGHRNHSM